MLKQSLLFIVVATYSYLSFAGDQETIRIVNKTGDDFFLNEDLSRVFAGQGSFVERIDSKNSADLTFTSAINKQYCMGDLPCVNLNLNYLSYKGHFEMSYNSSKPASENVCSSPIYQCQMSVNLSTHLTQIEISKHKHK